MKKIKLVARQDIIDHSTGRIHNDEGLLALDGIRYGKATKIGDNVDPQTVLHQLVQEFYNDNPNWRADRYSLMEESQNGQA